jgi:hypothetical protein
MMSPSPRHLWILGPVLLSLAGECNDFQSIGTAPSPIVGVTLTLDSPQVPPPANPAVQADYQRCLGLAPRPQVRPSWRDYAVIDLQPAGADRWQAGFNDVPSGYTHTIYVTDPNECARNPAGSGRTTTGVTVNGVAPRAALNGAMLFDVDPDGSVSVR